MLAASAATQRDLPCSHERSYKHPENWRTLQELAGII
jgi:hypothetical protein